MKYSTKLALPALLATILAAETTSPFPRPRFTHPATAGATYAPITKLVECSACLRKPANPFLTFDRHAPTAGELYAWVDSRQSTGHCGNNLHCRAKVVMPKTLAGSIISAGYMVYTANNGAMYVDHGTRGHIGAMTPTQAAQFAHGAMVDIHPYHACGVTEEDVGEVIKQAALALSTTCFETGKSARDQTVEVARC